uniref:Uncharacterized protein n=1 Tax=Anguilla anguilla TaxID=7936 RepID=A0A0E9WLP6_ANGAN
MLIEEQILRILDASTCIKSMVNTSVYIQLLNSERTSTALVFLYKAGERTHWHYCR